MPNDPDTHDDFKPTNKLENSGISLTDIVEQVNVHQVNHLHEKNIKCFFLF